MNSIRTWALLALAFFPSLALAGRGTFVGNGGHGVQFSGSDRIYVRDLVGAGLHQRPHFGVSIDPLLRVLLKASSFSFRIPQELLLRKLSDINERVPGLGDMIAGVLNSYAFVFTEEELSPILDRDDPVQLPPNAKVVQLANRYLNLVRVSRQGWNRLDEENQVALLIHEAVYSMVIPVDAPFGKKQPARTAREICASFFTEKSAEDPWSAYARLRRLIGIPGEYPSLEEIRQSSQWYLYLERRGRVKAKENIKDVIFSTPATLRERMQRFCKEVGRKVGSPFQRDYIAHSVLLRRAHEKHVDTYEAADGPEKQTFVSFHRHVKDALHIQFEATDRNCVREVEAHLSRAITDIW